MRRPTHHGCVPGCAPSFQTHCCMDSCWPMGLARPCHQQPVSGTYQYMGPRYGLGVHNKWRQSQTMSTPHSTRLALKSHTRFGQDPTRQAPCPRHEGQPLPSDRGRPAAPHGALLAG
jgi:hypothetical protein